ncbi:MAG: membrane protein [Lysobacterales bacterium]|nr:putative inner membrane transporter YedA [Xanthomonadales bacterium]
MLLPIIAAFATIYLVWGTTYLGLAVVLRTLPPFASGAIRFALAGAILYALLRLRGPAPLRGVPWKQAILAGILLSGFGNGLVIWGQQTVPSGIAALLVAALPLWILFFDTVGFARRRPGLKDLAGSAIGLSGVLLIVSQTRSFDGSGTLLPTLSILFATFAWAIGTLVQRAAVRPGQVGAFACAQMLAGAACQALCALAAGEWPQVQLADFTPTTVWTLLYLAVFGSVIAFSAYLWLVTRVSTPAVATYSLINPVVAMVLGSIVLGERIPAAAITASALVLVGVALVLWPGHRVRSDLPAMAPGAAIAPDKLAIEHAR